MRPATTGLLFLALAAAASGSEPAPEPRYDWVLFYYMAYDNNLDVYGRPVLNMLGRGIESDRVAVVVSADFLDEGGMKQFLLTRRSEMVMSIREEGSAEETTLATELDWLGKNLPAKRYALVFLDHGGQLAQMSQDQNPGRKEGSEWLRVPEVAEVVARWRDEIAGEVELLFLQQCGKGTLENYYALKDAARFVMGSQTRVGAPNHYYPALLRHLSAHPEIDGRAVAAKILVAERPEMFTSYCVLAASGLAELPTRLDAVLKPLLAPGGRPFAREANAAGPPCFDFGADEKFHDAIRLLRALYTANAIESAPLAAFERWVREELVAEHRVSPARQEVAGSWCGFSLLLPDKADALDRYPDYAIYADTLLDDLVRRILDEGP